MAVDQVTSLSAESWEGVCGTSEGFELGLLFVLFIRKYSNWSCCASICMSPAILFNDKRLRRRWWGFRLE